MTFYIFPSWRKVNRNEVIRQDATETNSNEIYVLLRITKSTALYVCCVRLKINSRLSFAIVYIWFCNRRHYIEWLPPPRHKTAYNSHYNKYIYESVPWQHSHKIVNGHNFYASLNNDIKYTTQSTALKWNYDTTTNVSIVSW